jgi:hypothetical protein
MDQAGLLHQEPVPVPEPVLERAQLGLGMDQAGLLHQEPVPEPERGQGLELELELERRGQDQ